MKIIVTTTARVLSAAAFIGVVGTAQAQINPPPWWGSQDPDSSYFSFAFDDIGTWDQPEAGFWDPFGPPTLTFDTLWWLNDLYDHQGMVGGAAGQTADLTMHFRNALRPTWTKHCWLQLDFYEAYGSDVSLGLETSQGSSIFNVQEHVDELGQGWYRTTVTFDIRPQPEWEDLIWTFTGGDPQYGQSFAGAWIDNLHFGTICVVPEPASMAVLALGGLALVRRRRR